MPAPLTIEMPDDVVRGLETIAAAQGKNIDALQTLTRAYNVMQAPQADGPIKWEIMYRLAQANIRTGQSGQLLPLTMQGQNGNTTQQVKNRLGQQVTHHPAAYLGDRTHTLRVAGTAAAWRQAQEIRQVIMAKNLLIVESPAKAKTIEKILGSDF